MDALNLYPMGMMPSGHPAAAQLLAPQAPPMPPGSAAQGGEEVALSSDEIDLLERILRDCHLDDGMAVPTASAPQVGVAPGHAPAFGQAAAPAQAAALPQAMVPVQGSPQAPPAGTASGEQLAVVPWADELVRRLLGCPSPEEARARCIEVLTAFRQQDAAAAAACPQAQRVQQLRSTNGVLLRGLRSLHRRHRDVDAQRLRAEEACARMAAELARCQEALRASERAKDNLQYHLQLMSSSPGITVGGM
uniref:Uncharacterized protein n=1 Tax=Alexandrium catenella TaxID=2925 RepID=A0A7S1SBA4_ALECA